MRCLAAVWFDHVFFWRDGCFSFVCLNILICWGKNWLFLFFFRKSPGWNSTLRIYLLLVWKTPCGKHLLQNTQTHNLVHPFWRSPTWHLQTHLTSQGFANQVAGLLRSARVVKMMSWVSFFTMEWMGRFCIGAVFFHWSEWFGSIIIYLEPDGDPFINAWLSIGWWFQIFRWEIVIQPNKILKVVVWSSRWLYIISLFWIYFGNNKKLAM